MNLIKSPAGNGLANWYPWPSRHPSRSSRASCSASSISSAVTSNPRASANTIVAGDGLMLRAAIDVAEPGDVRAVDLEGAHREALDVGEVRVTRAEVVHDQPDTGPLQLP